MQHPKLLNHPEAVCNIMRRIAMEAGEITLKYFDDTGFDNASQKGDGSPVTIADQEAEAHIEKALKDALPSVAFVGEEAYEENRADDISDAEYFWMVDALDGTKEFISGSGEYTVNIALIKNGEPIIGVVYVPVLGELFAGHHEGKAIRYLEDSDNEKDIYVRKPPSGGLTVVASKNHSNQDRLDEFLQPYKVAKTLKRGSSLKICSIAYGKADLYPRLGPTCEWDIAAGDAVLRAAGGVITDLAGNPIQYGKADGRFRNPEFVARPQELPLAA